MQVGEGRDKGGWEDLKRKKTQFVNIQEKKSPCKEFRRYSWEVLADVAIVAFVAFKNEKSKAIVTVLKSETQAQAICLKYRVKN